MATIQRLSVAVRPQASLLVTGIRGIALSRSLAALLAASTLLLLVWSFAVPIFEAPDEPDHWNYARYMHDHGGALPPYNPAYDEGNEPPLYYALIAPFAVSSDRPPIGLFTDAQGNIFVRFPPRFFINSSSDFAHYWPIREGRLVSVLLSVLTVLFCYLAGREATGKTSTGLLAGSLAAFLPQFTFRGMNVSTDTLVTTLCAVGLYLIVRLIRRGFTWRLAVVTAVVVAAAFLSKITGGMLAVPFALAILTETNPWRIRFTRLSVLGIALPLVAPGADRVRMDAQDAGGLRHREGRIRWTRRETCGHTWPAGRNVRSTSRR